MDLLRKGSLGTKTLDSQLQEVKQVAIFPVKRKIIKKNIINTTGISVERLKYIIKIRYTKCLSSER